jgi:predicted alpha-1,2-mannosidase
MSRALGRRTALLLAAAIVMLLIGVVVAETMVHAPGSSTSVVSPEGTVSSNGQQLANLTELVNPFIGTAPSPSPCEVACSGDVFPGAAYPMGMVQWSPDTISNPPGGYSYPDSVIKDLSLTHFSGRGCQVYQDFPFMPYVGNVSVSPSANSSFYYSEFSHSQESARPGFYRVHLEGPNVTVSLSATPHTGVGEFAFPPSRQSTILINAGGSVNGDSQSSVAILPSSEMVTGSAESVVGCGSNPYVVYFAAKFGRPFAGYGTWDEGAIDAGSSSSSGQHTGAYLVFDTTSDQRVDVQVGISFVSVANAELNLNTESVGFDLASCARAAAAAWNARLNSMTIAGGTHDEQVSFYTALYHVFFDPNIFNDDNGQYIGFDGRVHTVAPGHLQYENIAGWDQYRTHIRLLAMIYPSIASDIAQSLVNDAQQGNGGALPRWEQANTDSHGMSGDDADPVIEEAYAFGATGFNTTAALQAMINGQSQEREGYADYVKLGYVPADAYPGLSTASITLEYANDDFAIAQFAKALGNNSIYDTYLQRSADWRNVFNNASGYVQPRDANGSWAAGFNPTSDNGFQEGDSAQYTWMVPYDLPGLFNAMGGDQAALARLNAALAGLNVGPFSSFVWMGDEPSIQVPWEYDFLHAPAQTQSVVRQIEMQLWSNNPGGVPGNDDGGTMSSWFIFAAMGLYPEVTGVGGFVVGSPLFSSMTVQLAGAHTLQISAPAASDSTPYVQGLSVDGSATTGLWVPWSSVASGATIAFDLGSAPSAWGSAPGDAPPSFAYTG